MITHQVTADGYEFYNADKAIAVGTYTNLGFEVYENDDTISLHPNGMGAMTYLRRKYTPEFYTTDVVFSVPRVASKLDQFKSHPALIGVHPLPIENWKTK